MKNKASITSLMSAFGRAYHAEHEKQPVFGDTLARKLMTDEEYAMIENYILNGIDFFAPDKKNDFKDKDSAIVYIVNHYLSANARTFRPGTRGAELVSDMKIASENIFIKTKANALTSDDFTAFIRENNISEFYIAGADAACCVKSTCCNMAKAGYTVPVLSDCITSYDKKKLNEMFDYYAGKGCAVEKLSEVM